MLVATAGHVDHGKTSLVRALTGVDTDRLPEEKKRGLTIDLGFAYRDLGDGATLGFVDVPGHERFVRNMLAGVGAIDLGLVVVAADDGVMPQTREHLAILDLLGIREALVAITKVDLVEPGRVAEVGAAVEALLGATGIAGAGVFAVSNTSGAGVPELEARLLAHARRHAPRADAGRFRLAVDRVFSVQGAGLVVTGTGFSGRVEEGERLVCARAGREARVRAIHAQGRAVTSGRAGERLALNLAGPGIDTDAIARGEWVVAAPVVEVMSDRVDVRLRLLPGDQRALMHWAPVHVHHGAGSTTARVALLEGSTLEAGGDALAQVVCDEPLCAVAGDRLVLRDQSARHTLGGATVIDPHGPRRGRTRTPRLDFLRLAEAGSDADALDGLLAHAVDGVDMRWFARTRNLRDEELAALVAPRDVVRIEHRDGDRAFSPDAWRRLETGLAEALRRWHEAHADRIGPGEAELRQAMASRPPLAAVAAALRRLIDEGRIERQGARLRLPGHRPTLPDADARLWAKIGGLLGPEETRPPVVAELAGLVGMERPALEAFLRRQLGRGLLSRLAPNRYFHPEAVRRLAAVAVELGAESPDGLFDAKAYRDRSGIGRNLTIQVLESFDQTGFTRRMGDARRVVAPVERAVGGG